MARSIGTYLIVVTLIKAGVGFSYPTPVDFNGNVLKWDDISPENPVIFEVINENVDESDYNFYAPLITEAALLWSEVENSRLALSEKSGEENAQITVYLVDSSGFDGYASGYAVFDEYDGEKPKHCSAYIYIDYSFSINSISKTILHELGHCVGLGHSLIPEAIMSYQLDKNRFALDIDDRAAIARLYPEDSENAKLPPGCSISMEARQQHGSLIYAIFLLPLLTVAITTIGSFKKAA